MKVELLLFFSGPRPARRLERQIPTEMVYLPSVRKLSTHFLLLVCGRLSHNPDYLY